MSYKVKSRTLGEANMPWSALKYPVLATIKYDGRNTIVHKDDEEITYETSGGKTFTLLDNSPFDTLPNGHYFTEMLGNGIAGKLGDRVHSGIQTSCVSNTSKGIENSHKPNWKIFSYLTDEDYQAGKAEYNYHRIFEELGISLEAVDAIEALPKGKMCENEQELQEYYQEVIADGWEGLMISDASQKWNNSSSRLKTLVKLKGRPSMKGICTAVEPGGIGTKYRDMIGSLAISVENGTTVRIGSGLSDEDRSQDESYFLGKVIEFNYEQLSALGIPLQPTYVSVREAL